MIHLSLLLLELILVLSVVRIDRFLLGESTFPFIGEGCGLTSDRESESVCVLVLLPTPMGTRQFVGAHNTVDAQMHVVDFIVFF